jgi:hypothetical protein
MENTIKEPIYKGCTNRECFCTGKCKEIIGYKERPMNRFETAWLDSSNFNDTKLIQQVFNSVEGRISNGMFIDFMGKVAKINLNNYELIREQFIDKILSSLSGSVEIEPELTEREFINLERIRQIPITQFKITKL